MRTSATFRLAALVAAVVTGLSLAGLALGYRLVEARLMSAAEAALKADVAGLAALYDQRRVPALRQAIEFRKAAGDPTWLILRDRAGTALAATREPWPAALPVEGAGLPAAPRVFAAGGARWIGAASTLPGGFPLMVAHPLAEPDATLAALRRGGLLLTALMLAAGAAAGWLAARRVLARIDRVNRLADRVAGGDLAARLPGPPAGDEFGQLQAHVHAMLDRIETLNRATHRLSGAIAHELRTPLNRLSQRLAAVPDPQLRDDLQAEVKAAVRVFDALLDIARTEADRGAGGLLPLDLSQTAAAMAELYEAPAEEAGMLLISEIEPDQRIQGEETLISQLISNLFDNALKYCRPGDRLSLRLASDGAETVLTLADTGPGLPAAIRGEAFEPFVRGEHAGTPGHGLGLALVRAIAARHGARLVLPPAEKGFVVEIRWPKLARDS